MKGIVLFYFVFFGLLSWPVIIWANRVEPVVWGIPFFVFYCYVVGFLGAIGHMLIGLFRLKDPQPENGGEGGAA